MEREGTIKQFVNEISLKKQAKKNLPGSNAPHLDIEGIFTFFKQPKVGLDG